MKTYDYKCLRGAILETLCYLPFEAVRLKGLLNALRPEFPSLAETVLKGEIKYLEQKGYVKTDTVENYINQGSTEMVTITAEGKDVKEGTRKDPGVICGE